MVKPSWSMEDGWQRMAKLIGGPLHNQIIEIHGMQSEKFIIPVFPNDRTPKQCVRHMNKAVYKRTRIVRGGEIVYRFIYGYYDIRYLYG
jgi:hypothetical protein